jgi:hypothetical protein
VPVEAHAASACLTTVLRLLNHPPPPELENDTPDRLLLWAICNWNIKAFERLSSVTVDELQFAK